MAEKRKDSKNRILKDGEYEKTNGTYEYRWRDKNGSKHSIYAKTLDELREKEADTLRDLLNGLKYVDKNLTINDMYERWVDIKRGLKDNVFQNYQYMYTQFVKPKFGKTKLCVVKKTDVRKFYNYLHDAKHIRVATIDSIHTVLHQVLELAVEDEYISSNPANNALKELKKAHSSEFEKRKALTVSQQEIFENFLAEDEQSKHWQPVFTTMLYTGMRVGEITGLRWRDIDFKNNFISVNHTLVYYAHRDKSMSTSKNQFAINTTKTAAGYRIIPMLSNVRKALLQEREYQENMGITCKAVIDGYTDFVFVNRFGNVQHQGTLNKVLRRIIRDCNYRQLDRKSETLPPFSCHILRHTFATRMIEANVNIKAAQEILGHSDVQVTLDIYADATKELKAREAVTLEEYFKGIIGNFLDESGDSKTDNDDDGNGEEE